VLVPRAAGVLSALGCLAAETRVDLGRAVLEPVSRWGARRLEALFTGLEEEAGLALEREGVPVDARRLVRSLAMRYRGQAYEIEVPLPAELEDETAGELFHRHHAARYGYARPEAAVEIVAAQVTAVGRTRAPRLPDHRSAGREGPVTRRLTIAGDDIEVASWHWEDLPAGHASDEPTIVFGDHATALVPPGWSWHVDRMGNLIAEVGA
jgi:N-methylhydantoinase A